MTKKQFDPPASRRRLRGVAKGERPEESGQPIRGRIVQLVRGQGHGIIRTRDAKLFFHRSDVVANGFNDLKIGDAVTGEAIADRISGSRAVKVQKA